MRRRLPAGLRWRLLVALVLTSAVTLGVAAVVVLKPLQKDLRNQSAENLRNTVLNAAPDIQRALAAKPKDRAIAVSDRAFDLRYQTDARVLVGDEALMPPDGGTPPGFIADTDLFSDTRRPVYVAVRAMNHGETVVDIVGDSLAVGVPLFDGSGVSGVVIAERRLTEVTTLVGQVRNAFLAAAGVGLLVAVLLATGLSSTLLRRLARLRSAALRITEAGPDAPPMPHDERRDEVGDLARALARMQEGGWTPPCRCARSPSSSASWPARWPRSSSCARGSATSRSTSCPPRARAGAAAIRTRWRAWCASCSTTRCATARAGRRCRYSPAGTRTARA
jgi:hypothetical protein